MREAINAMSYQQYLFLIDLPGGTLVIAQMAIMMQNPSVEVLAGVNLPTIVNAAFEREGRSTTGNRLQNATRNLVKTAFKIFLRAIGTK